MPQASLAVTVKVTLLVHWPVGASTTMFAGQVIEGGCVSLMVTVKLQVLEFPEVSVAVKVLVVVPTGKVEPLGNPAIWARVMTPGQLSLRVTA
jgi:hypothetical protein